MSSRPIVLTTPEKRLSAGDPLALLSFQIILVYTQSIFTIHGQPFPHYRAMSQDPTCRQTLMVKNHAK